MNQKKSNHMPENLEINDIILNTNPDLMSIPCDNIGNEKRWKKNCPVCNKEQVYKTKYIFNASFIKNTKCGLCANREIAQKKIIIDRPVVIWKKNCPRCNREQIYTCKYILKEAVLKNKSCNRCRRIEEQVIIPPEGWSKLCLSCGKKQIYSCKCALIASIKQNTICNPCRLSKTKLRNLERLLIRTCPTCNIKINYKTMEGYSLGNKKNSDCIKCATKKSAKVRDKSVFKTLAYRQKLSAVLKLLRNSSSYGEAFKQKCRENKLKQISKQGVQRTYNPTACKFIDDLNKNRGWKLQHAMNGGEINVSGYSLDGYDKNKNIIFEYDEPKHLLTSVKDKDIIRQNRLINQLNPTEFWRYDEKHDNLYNVIENNQLNS